IAQSTKLSASHPQADVGQSRAPRHGRSSGERSTLPASALTAAPGQEQRPRPAQQTAETDDAAAVAASWEPDLARAVKQERRFARPSSSPGRGTSGFSESNRANG